MLAVTKPKPKPENNYEVLSDDERWVMRAFGRRPMMCIHQLQAMTSIPYVDLLKVTAQLQRRGKIFRTQEMCLGKDDYQFQTRQEDAVAPVQFIEGRASPLVGLSIQDMAGRVVMLKRMRRLLIVDWHPIIDILIGDYERDIKRLRPEPDDDEDGEPDVLDQDMDMED